MTPPAHRHRKAQQIAKPEEGAAEHEDAAAEEDPAEDTQKEPKREMEAEHLPYSLFFATPTVRKETFFNATVKVPTNSSSSRWWECSTSTSTRCFPTCKTLRSSADSSRL
jgi:hypothetical protein